MKLLKYVMTSDTGLAPNPYFGICSLAVCTPNHRNARLCVDDWIVGHSTKATGHKLIYAMRVTRILTMPEYFKEYPQKHPNPYGDQKQRCGDNFYDNSSGKWRRLPSPCHNNVHAFAKDQGKPVFLSKNEKDFWYFGGMADSTTTGFQNWFPDLIKDRQGFSYVYDEDLIERFAAWLTESGRSGLIGEPRDAIESQPDRYLVAIYPERWSVRSGIRNPDMPEREDTRSGCARKSDKRAHSHKSGGTKGCR